MGKFLNIVVHKLQGAHKAPEIVGKTCECTFVFLRRSFIMFSLQPFKQKSFYIDISNFPKVPCSNFFCPHVKQLSDLSPRPNPFFQFCE